MWKNENESGGGFMIAYAILREYEGSDFPFRRNLRYVSGSGGGAGRGREIYKVAGQPGVRYTNFTETKIRRIPVILTTRFCMFR